MTQWRWVGLDVTVAIHDRQLAEHGGLSGLRDGGALEAALASPQNLESYGAPDAADLAAAYAFSLARNHAFNDGNKRTAWVVARLFLEDNGFRLRFDLEDAIAMMISLAAGLITRDQVASWFRNRIVTSPAD